MPKIAIMTDNNCGIMPADASQYHIHVLPMPVLVGEETFYEGYAILLRNNFTRNWLPDNL